MAEQPRQSIMPPNTHKAGHNTTATFITAEQKASGADPAAVAQAIANRATLEQHTQQGVGQRGIRVQHVAGPGAMFATPQAMQHAPMEPMQPAAPGVVAPASHAPMRANASGRPASNLELGRRPYAEFRPVRELVTGEIAIYGTAAYGLAFAFGLPLQTVLGAIAPDQVDAEKLSGSPELAWLVVTRDWMEKRAPELLNRTLAEIAESQGPSATLRERAILASGAHELDEPAATSLRASATGSEADDAGAGHDPVRPRARAAMRLFPDATLAAPAALPPAAAPEQQAVPPLGAEGEAEDLSEPSVEHTGPMQRGAFGFTAGPELHVVMRGPVVLYSAGRLRVHHATEAESGTDIVQIEAEDDEPREQHEDSTEPVDEDESIESDATDSEVDEDAIVNEDDPVPVPDDDNQGQETVGDEGEALDEAQEGNDKP